MRKRVFYACVPLLAIGLYLSLRRARPLVSGHDGAEEADAGSSHIVEIPLSKRIFRPTVEKDPNYLPTLEGLDLTKLRTEGASVSTELADKTIVKLTLDANLQRTATALLRAHAIPESSIVMVDPATGHILAYASHIEGKPARDLNVEATAPAASVFKMVTGTALVDVAGLTPETSQCYSGGEQRVTASDLEEGAEKDKHCATLSSAMGRSLNTVFARLAQKHLPRERLGEVAKNFYFGRQLPFDVPVQVSSIAFPDDALGYARTAAGFWNTTLSPLHAAFLSATFARGGEPMRPVIISEVTRSDGKKIYGLGEPVALHRVMSEKTAAALTTMLESTVSDGTSFRAFHDKARVAFLPGITVAGKTGTLTDAQNKRYYTWFTGFAPSRAVAGERSVAISVLVSNGAIWKVKANVVAREMLRAFFAQAGAQGVAKPNIPEAKSSALERSDSTASEAFGEGMHEPSEAKAFRATGHQARKQVERRAR